MNLNLLLIILVAIIVLVLVIGFSQYSPEPVEGHHLDKDKDVSVNIIVGKGDLIYCSKSVENKSGVICDSICCIDNDEYKIIDKYLENKYMK